MKTPAVKAEVVRDVEILGGWVKVRRTEVRMPDGAVVERHIEDHGPGVAVLPYDPVRKVALVISQPRVPVLLAGGGDIIETIAGRLDGSDPADRILQEAMEEGGVRLTTLELVVHAWTIPSISTERLHLYLAPYEATDRFGVGGGAAEEHENITVREISLADLAVAAASGALPDAKTLILVQALQIRRPDLFA
ncbi:NUDIX hydrolase [Brevundimonas goettingensis]|jgi:nudix-type nucleoside diphosphatase (YffH/AdpP family)|uniref:GDP-mannose pyrophosphatase n=1 Tax=Brevundimonas goettingensis TaxID=2774190 RepID=A0A975C3H0_9CAUL|nr:NUDIX hydrolase [Brevundimonas goettingensis]QTC91185.1 NUDIX hydrolase [Brevundimonas goettingensis]